VNRHAPLAVVYSMQFLRGPCKAAISHKIREKCECCDIRITAVTHVQSIINVIIGTSKFQYAVLFMVNDNLADQELDNFKEAYLRNCQSQSFQFEAFSMSKRRGRGEDETAKNCLAVPRGNCLEEHISLLVTMKC